MNRYSTQQRKSLLEFLKNNPHSSFSAKQIKDTLSDLKISISAVYRNLAILEKDGLLQKVHVSHKKEVTYQYVGAEACAGLIHLICEDCKKSYHFEKDFSELIAQSALELSGFIVNKQKTFIHGLCQTCLTHNN